MARLSTLPVLSVCAVALVAAAIGDPLVESISNTGLFGHVFSDANQQSAVPALIAGLGLAAIVAVVRLRDRLTRSAANSQRRLRELAAALASSAALRNLAAIFIAQVALVFVMEWSEALLCGGQTPHGLSWLGGPVFFSLCVHFVVCVACAVGMRGIARSLLASVVATICDVLERLIVILSREAPGAAHARFAPRLIARYEFVSVRRLRGRAPPTLTAFV